MYNVLNKCIIHNTIYTKGEYVYERGNKRNYRVREYSGADH